MRAERGSGSAPARQDKRRARGRVTSVLRENEVARKALGNLGEAESTGQ